MKYFVFLVNPDGPEIPDAMRQTYEGLPHTRGLKYRWQSFPHAAVLTAWDGEQYDAVLAVDGDHLGVGMVRLDNRSELEAWSGAWGARLTDIELVLRTVAQHGTKYVPRMLGDFAFVVSSAPTRTVVAACDAFAVKKLYYAERDGILAFASRAEALVTDERYEPQYFAELVGMCIPSEGLCAYAGVQSLPEGCMLLTERGRRTMRRYWSAWEFEPRTLTVPERQVAETCRDLLGESIRLRLGEKGDTWAQLSGGLDSSSVASMIQWLHQGGVIGHGLAGTITHVDRQGTASDERRYSNAVIDRWGLRNEALVDPPLWVDDEYPPPRTDQPRMDYPSYPQDRRLAAVVEAAGGRVVLTGIGGDELFTGYTYFFADWLVRGRIWPAFREVARRAAMGRVSMWELAYENAVLPLLPRLLRDRLARAGGRVPSWVPEQISRRYRLRQRTFTASMYQGPLGHKAHHGTVTNLVGMGRLLEPGVMGESLDVRHPFLYRPLVEFAAQLPPELCAKPHQRKWVLREAMRDILPDLIRTRVGKGYPAEVYAWSLTAQRPLLEPLVRDSILADMGVVDPHKLRAAFDAVPNEPFNIDHRHTLLCVTLAMEAWLQVRSGRWPRGGHRSTSTARSAVHHPSV